MSRRCRWCASESCERTCPDAVGHALRADVARLTRELEEARAVLREVEWAGQNQWGERQCSLCHGDEAKEGEPRTGHRPGCRLAAVLSGT